MQTTYRVAIKIDVHIQRLATEIIVRPGPDVSRIKYQTGYTGDGFQPADKLPGLEQGIPLRKRLTQRRKILNGVFERAIPELTEHLLLNRLGKTLGDRSQKGARQKIFNENVPKRFCSVELLKQALSLLR